MPQNAPQKKGANNSAQKNLSQQSSAQKNSAKQNSAHSGSVINNKAIIIGAVVVALIVILLIVILILVRRNGSTDPQQTTRSPLDSAETTYFPVTSETDNAIDGYIYGKDWSGPLANTSGDVVIPDSYKGKPVIGIQPGVFAGCRITSITIPGTVKIIPNGCFDSITTLEKVTVGEGVEEIGISAFSKCGNLTEIILPSTIKYFHAGAIAETKWWNDRPDGAVYLGGIFVKYKGTVPTNFTISDGTRVIAGTALYDTAVESVTIPDTVKYIGTEAFGKCSKLTSLTLPESVAAFDWQAFRESGIKTLKILGDRVVKIDKDEILDLTFKNVLEKVILPSEAVKNSYAADPIWGNYSAKFVVE